MPFNGINELRGKCDTHTITPDQLIEIQKCYDNPETRDDTWRETVTKHVGEIRFKQEYMCEFVGGDNNGI